MDFKKTVRPLDALRAIDLFAPNSYRETETTAHVQQALAHIIPQLSKRAGLPSVIPTMLYAEVISALAKVLSRELRVSRGRGVTITIGLTVNAVDEQESTVRWITQAPLL